MSRRRPVRGCCRSSVAVAIASRAVLTSSDGSPVEYQVVEYACFAAPAPAGRSRRAGDLDVQGVAEVSAG